MAAALSGLRRLASLPLTRADLHNYSVLWNVRGRMVKILFGPETLFVSVSMGSDKREPLLQVLLFLGD